MSEILNYAVYKLELDEIENSDDWFDANGRLNNEEIGRASCRERV